MVKLDNEFKSKRKEGLAKKQNAFDSVNALYEGVELIFNVQMWNISEIRQIIHSLSWAEEIAKKLYTKIANFIKL